MVIARGDSGDDEKRTLLLIGLSRANLAAMLAGRPVNIKDTTHPGVPKGWQIVIMAGETEQAIYETVKEAGKIGPQTEVIKDPRL